MTLMQMWEDGSIVGQPVRRGKHAAIVHAKYDDVKGGVRLDRLVDDFYSWNVADLKLEPPYHTALPSAESGPGWW